MKVIELSINHDHKGVRLKIHPVVVQTDKMTLLVDCGHPGDLKALKSELGDSHLTFDEITHLFITHHDHDHMGAAAEILAQYPHVQVVTSEVEAPYVRGEKKSLRLTQAEEIYDFLPESEKDGARQFQAYLEHIEPVEVQRTLGDREFIDDERRIMGVMSPGHMPGHMSIYLPEKALLITGDALMLAKGHLHIPNPQYAMDPLAAKETLKKLTTLKINECLCYHGGHYQGDFKTEIINLLEK